MLRGAIVSVNVEKAYGFIASGDHDENVFFRFDVVDGLDRGNQENQQIEIDSMVSYELNKKKSRGGLLTAKRVRLL
jgi:cold shock CspA family protein